MKIQYSLHFQKRLKKRLHQKPSLKKKLSKQIKLFKQNRHHPSLKVHKLQGQRVNEHSFWIEKNLRITFLLLGKTTLFTDIITHDEY